MGNNKMIKTAAAVALGASVVATAVAPGAASAATTYKLKSGKLVNAKTGKVVKGYKVYKSTLYKDGKKAKGYVTSGKVLYKNGKKFTGLRSAKYYKAGKVATGTYKGVYYKTGKKFTGLKSGVYYKAGVKGTGSYKSVYYKNGKKHTGLVGATYYKAGKKGTGSYKGIQYKSGKAVTGVVNDVYYNNGVKATAVVDGVQYVDGDIANEVYKGVLYVAGKAAQGEVEGKFYNNGKIAQGEVDGVVYVDGIKDVTAPVITVVEAQTVKFGAETPDTTKFVTAVKDNSGEVIEASAVKVSSITLDGKAVEAIDTKVAGEYTVTFTVSDKNGNEGKATVTVTVEKAVFAVTAVTTAPTTTGVTVSFDALTEDQEGVEIEVKNSKGEVVAVKPVNLSKGDKEAQFVYVTAQKTTDLVGTWTFGAAEYNFDAVAQLAAIKTAVTNNNIVELQKALKAAGITAVTETDAVLAKYKEDLAAANNTSKLNTLADVQAVITKTNEALAANKTEAEKVEAVTKATGQVSLLAALQANFKRVNEAWIAQYVNFTNGFQFTNGDPVTTAVYKSGNVVSSPKVADVQAVIDAVNVAQVSAVWDAAWNGADSKKLTEAKALLSYIAEDTDAEKESKTHYVDEATRLAAVLNVFAVSASTNTNGAFEKAVKELDAVETTLVEKYKGTAKATNFSDELKIADFKPELLTAYRTALNAVTAPGDKNQAKDVQNVITAVNDKKLSDLTKDVTDAAVAYDPAAATTTDADKADKAKKATALLTAIKALAAYDSVTFKDVVIKDSRVDAYDAALATTSSTIKAAIDTANTNAGKAAVTEVATKAKDLTATATVADVLKALQSDELTVENLVSANIEAYIAEDLTGVTTAAELQGKIDAANAVVALNAATTEEAAKTAIAALKITDFTDVKTVDKAYVAGKVLELRKDETDAKFANSTTATTKVEAAVTAYKSLLGKFVAPEASTSTQITVLSDLKYDAFDKHADQAAVAEYFKENFFKTGTPATAIAYTSLTDVKEAVDAAIAATK